jgi:polysaccharide export outer membrane protein
MMGDIARQGEIAYRPGMTVRQAIALAGGFGIMPNRTFDPYIQFADLSAQIDELLIERARDEMRIQRINTELAGKAEPPEFSTAGTTLAAEQVANLARIEKERFLVNLSDRTKQLSFLKDSLENTATQINTLSEQIKREKEGMTAEIEEGDRLTQLSDKGLATSARVFEARRSILFASARYLQTVSQLTQLQKEQAELNRQLSKLQDERRAVLLQELQEAIVRLDVTASKIRSAMDKLNYTTGAKASLQERNGQPPALFILRQLDGKPTNLHVSDDTMLMPGDVVQAKLGSRDETGAAVQTD